MSYGYAQCFGILSQLGLDDEFQFPFDRPPRARSGSRGASLIGIEINKPLTMQRPTSVFQPCLKRRHLAPRNDENPIPPILTPAFHFPLGEFLKSNPQNGSTASPISTTLRLRSQLLMVRRSDQIQSALPGQNLPGFPSICTWEPRRVALSLGIFLDSRLRSCDRIASKLAFIMNKEQYADHCSERFFLALVGLVGRLTPQQRKLHESIECGGKTPQPIEPPFCRH